MGNTINILNEFPEKSKLIKDYGWEKITKANGHIHTPFSFSAFDSIPQVFDLAKAEKIEAIGINDFIVTDGYAEFAKYAFRAKVFPLFNIEFMGLIKELQKKDIRVNDPNNPGRIYFSGKGLKFPVSTNNGTTRLLNKVKEESNLQTRQMVEKLNSHLKKIEAPFELSYDELKKDLAKELVRERHLAKALRIKIFDYYKDEHDRAAFIEKLYNGKTTKYLNNISALENEIRGILLKKGGVAFVEEDENAFLELDKIIEVILSLGGIPCYPVLLDDPQGKLTEFEGDYEAMYQELAKRNVYCIELIPVRNDINMLREFVRFFRAKGFVITFGTEHNTPELIPLTVDCRNGQSLDEELKRVNHEGVCIIAAHQYLQAKGEEGFIDKEGNPKPDQYDYFKKLGQAVINYFIKN
jgi:hypothetical protein